MRNHYVIGKDSNIPLVGVNVFGIIDRGTNLLQTRPISGCPLNCIYCSVDEGRFSSKPNTYEVEYDYLLKWFRKVADYKGVNDIEAHIDGIGEPLLYDDIVELVKGLNSCSRVKTVSIQTNGVLLSEELINALSKAGLKRINLSINTLDPDLARRMSGTDSYDVNKIKRLAELISESSINLLIAPVIVPGFNEDMSDLIEFAEGLGADLGVQKYEKQKHGRGLKVEQESWYSFKKSLKEWEEEYDADLLMEESDFNIHKTKSYPIIFEKGDKVNGRIVLPGWLSNEVIIRVKNRLITVFHAGSNKIGDRVNAEVVKNKHNLYLARKL